MIKLFKIDDENILNLLKFSVIEFIDAIYMLNLIVRSLKYSFFYNILC